MRDCPRRSWVGATTAILLLAANALPAAASDNLSFSGYLKTLYSYSRSPLNQAPYWADLTRARLGLEAALPLTEGMRWTTHVDYDQELRAGTYLQSLDYRMFGLAEPPSYFKMDQVLGHGGSYFWRHRFYRAWTGIDSDNGTARFGRQRIAWGTGKFWNPTDVLNPFDPTTLERDERRGVDSVYVRRAVSVLGQGEAAWALGRDWPSTDLLGRAHGHAGPSDWSVMGGKISQSTGSWMAGGDFAADLFGGNLHGEWSYTEPGVRTSYWRALVGYEYTLSGGVPSWLKDADLIAEYFDNGRGATNPARYDPGILLGGKEVALARDYLGFGFVEDVHPLVKLELYTIVNLDDSSFFINPLLTWNALKDLYLSAGLQRFGGSRMTEYGRLANVFYLQGQYFF